MQKQPATREIQIDAGHRIPNHHSQCRRLHGHRYVIQMTVLGPLVEEGSSEGMVMDFGFMKEIMMKKIHDVCDHRTMLYVGDPLLTSFKLDDDENRGLKESIRDMIVQMPMIPTAENLARYWFRIIEDEMKSRSDLSKIDLLNIRVYETPNCWADFGRSYMKWGVLGREDQDRGGHRD